MSKKSKDSKKEHSENETITEKVRLNVKKIIIISSIIILIIFLFLFLKINFLVDEKLRMTISPEYLEIDTTSPGTFEVDVDVKLYNRVFCTSTCNYELIDLSNDKLLDNGTFDAKAFRNEKYSKDIFIDSNGYGTNLYIYRIECTTDYTTLCPELDTKLVRKSLFVASYTPNDSWLSALDFSKKSYNLATQNFVNASKIHFLNGKIISELGLQIDTSNYNYIDSKLYSLKEDFDKVISVWDSQDIVSAKSLIESKNIVLRSDEVLIDAQNYNTRVLETYGNYTALLNNLYSVQDEEIIYRNTLVFDKYLYTFELANFNNSGNYSYNLVESVSEFNSLAHSVSKNSYSQIYTDYSLLKNKNDGINDAVGTQISLTLEELYPFMYVQSKILCAVNPDECIDKSYYDYVSKTQNTAIDNQINDYYAKLSSLCFDSQIIKTQSIDYLNFSSKNINNSINDSENNSTNISNSDNSNPLYKESLDSLIIQYRLLLDYYSDTNNAYALSYLNLVSDKLSTYYSIEAPENYTQIIDISEVSFTKNGFIYSNISSLDLECSNVINDLSIKNYLEINSLPNLPNPNFISEVSSPEALSIIESNLQGSIKQLQEFDPKCCIYGNCNSCTELSRKNPLIMLHGHSFIQDNSAYGSVEIFNSFERKFNEEKIYFPSGIVVESDDSTPQILGRYDVALMSKPTYYIQTYNDLLGLKTSESKTGNIDSYALRLKEQIEYTKYITGAQKVDILAHSMGGLVVRRYIQIFGSDDVDKIVLIGTPNNGITDRVYTFCRLLGETNECDDMHTGSLFLKKLNGEKNSLNFNNLYLVIGRGCDTDGLDGDGVVASNNSIIKDVPKHNILYVEGKCSGSKVLHLDMLNEKLYPEVYWFVKEKLSE